MKKRFLSLILLPVLTLTSCSSEVVDKLDINSFDINEINEKEETLISTTFKSNDKNYFDLRIRNYQSKNEENNDIYRINIMLIVNKNFSFEKTDLFIVNLNQESYLIKDDLIKSTVYYVHFDSNSGVVPDSLYTKSIEKMVEPTSNIILPIRPTNKIGNIFNYLKVAPVLITNIYVKNLENLTINLSYIHNRSLFENNLYRNNEVNTSLLHADIYNFGSIEF